jgi:hypothetical protein
MWKKKHHLPNLNDPNFSPIGEVTARDDHPISLSQNLEALRIVSSMIKTKNAIIVHHSTNHYNSSITMDNSNTYITIQYIITHYIHHTTITLPLLIIIIPSGYLT